MIFSNSRVELMAEKLCVVLYYSNLEGYLCGHGSDQVYGPAYEALKNLLNKEFGEEVTNKAMNSRTWSVGDFYGQTVPAIQAAIEEVEAEKEYHQQCKMVEVANSYGYEAYISDDGIIIQRGDLTLCFKDWNELMEYLTSKPVTGN